MYAIIKALIIGKEIHSSLQKCNKVLICNDILVIHETSCYNHKCMSGARGFNNGGSIAVLLVRILFLAPYVMFV